MKVADLNLSLTEVIALYFLKGHARLYQGTDIETEINRAFAKLDTFVPDGFEKRLEKVKTLFSPASQFAKDYTGKEKIIDDLTEAILQQKTCQIEYHSLVMINLKTSKSIHYVSLSETVACMFSSGLHHLATSESWL